MVFYCVFSKVRVCPRRKHWNIIFDFIQKINHFIFHSFFCTLRCGTNAAAILITPTAYTMNNEHYILRGEWTKKKLEKFAFVWNSRYTPDSERMMYVSRIQPNAICITNPQESTLLFNLSLASNPIVNTNLHVHLFWSQTFFNSFEVKSLHWTIRGYYL